MPDRPRVLVVGTGSVGSRHIRNLLTLGADVSAYRYRQHLGPDLLAAFPIRLFPSLEQALDARPDAVVVCNRTDQHMDVALDAARRGCHLFLEKPISHTLEGVDELAATAQSKSLVVEVGCVLRFHPNLRAIEQVLRDGAAGQPYCVRAFHGQYLPEWRPRQDYRESYSARREHGGGIVLDWIHEIDYLIWWFGEPVEVTAGIAHVSDLETDTEDVADILLRFAGTMRGSIHLNCLRPGLARGCEIVTSDAAITWDYVRGTVHIHRRGATEGSLLHAIEGFDRNTLFVDAMRHFLSRVRSGGEAVVGLDDGIKALQVALAVFRSAAERRTIALRESSIEVCGGAPH